MFRQINDPTSESESIQWIKLPHNTPSICPALVQWNKGLPKLLSSRWTDTLTDEFLEDYLNTIMSWVKRILKTRSSGTAGEMAYLSSGPTKLSTSSSFKSPAADGGFDPFGSGFDLDNVSTTGMEDERQLLQATLLYHLSGVLSPALLDAVRNQFICLEPTLIVGDASVLNWQAARTFISGKSKRVSSPLISLRQLICLFRRDGQTLSEWMESVLARQSVCVKHNIIIPDSVYTEIAWGQMTNQEKIAFTKETVVKMRTFSLKFSPNEFSRFVRTSVNLRNVPVMPGRTTRSNNNNQPQHTSQPGQSRNPKHKGGRRKGSEQLDPKDPNVCKMCTHHIHTIANCRNRRRTTSTTPLTPPPAPHSKGKGKGRGQKGGG